MPRSVGSVRASDSPRRRVFGRARLPIGVPVVSTR
jgi:hypothetical protein